MNLGEKIYELRMKMNLSQGDLAEKLDVSRQSVSKWENNTAVPDLDKLIKICDVFEISLDELTGREKREEKTPNSISDIITRLSKNQKLGWGLIGIAILCLVIPFGIFFTLPLVIISIMNIKEVKNIKVYTVWLVYLFFQLAISIFCQYYIGNITEVVCLILLCIFTFKCVEIKVINISKLKSILILLGGIIYDFLYVLGIWWCFYSKLTEWEFHSTDSGGTIIVGKGFSPLIYAVVNTILTAGIGFSFVGIKYGVKSLSAKQNKDI